MTYGLCAGTIIMAQMKYFGTMEKEDDHMSQNSWHLAIFLFLVSAQFKTSYKMPSPLPPPFDLHATIFSTDWKAISPSHTDDDSYQHLWPGYCTRYLVKSSISLVT